MGISKQTNTMGLAQHDKAPLSTGGPRKGGKQEAVHGCGCAFMWRCRYRHGSGVHVGVKSAGPLTSRRAYCTLGSHPSHPPTSLPWPWRLHQGLPQSIGKAIHKLASSL